MSNSCEQLTPLGRTLKLEREIKKKIDVDREPSIVHASVVQSVGAVPVLITAALAKLTPRIAVNYDNNLLNGKRIKNNANVLSKVNQKVASTNTIANQAYASSVKVGEIAKKAEFDALYAKSRTASNASKIAKVGGTALKAFNLVSSVFSLISTFATIAVVAKLTIEIANLKKQTRRNTVISQQNSETSLRNSRELKKQRREIEVNRTRLTEYQKYNRELAIRIRDNEILNKLNSQRITTIENEYEASISQIQSKLQTIESQTKTAINQAKQATDKANQAIIQANQTSDKANQAIIQAKKATSDISKLTQKVENDTEQTIKEVVEQEINENINIINLNDKVTNHDLNLQTLKNSSKTLENSIEARDREVFRQAKNLEKRINEIKNNEVNNQQAQQLNNKLDTLDNKISNFPSPATIALAVGGLDILRQIKQNSSKSTCQAPALVPPVAAQAKANGAATLGLQTINTAQNAAIQKTVSAVNQTVNVTKNVVTHAKYGLQAMQNFAQTAWKATRIGKILEYLSLAATIHNAAMLSRNLGGSLGDTVSAIANNTISLIKNEEFQGININQTLGTSIEGFLKNLIGTENYTGVSETLTKYNRIVNSASNVIYSITSIQAGLAQGLETIGNYTGRIGNALKKSGQVLESSYGWMSEKTSVKTGRLGQIQRVIDTGEGIENVASDIQNATQEFREAQENVNNIGQQYDKVKTEFTDQETEKAVLETTVKTNSQGAQPELTDFVKDPIEE